MKKTVLILIVFFIFGKTFCQQSPYTLPLPEKWGMEKIAFPISFAPEISYNGNEEIRFTPGWGNEASEEYWSYTFLWFINGTPKIDQIILQDNFSKYFSGLYRLNNKKQPVASDLNFTKPKIEKVETVSGDTDTYRGKISTLNFLNGKDLELFAIMHIRAYADSQHTAVLVEFSPKPYEHSVWQKLNAVVDGFRYNK